MKIFSMRMVGSVPDFATLIMVYVSFGCRNKHEQKHCPTSKINNFPASHTQAYQHGLKAKTLGYWGSPPITLPDTEFTNFCVIILFKHDNYARKRSLN
jgi:hypothetical protein